jgi:Holliday junction DNA helicase RuvA
MVDDGSEMSRRQLHPTFQFCATSPCCIFFLLPNTFGVKPVFLGSKKRGTGVGWRLKSFFLFLFPNSMIAYLDGKLAYKDATQAHHGHGRRGHTRSAFRWPRTRSCPTKAALTKIYTYQHIKEDGQTLYGFLDPNEKALFMLLIGVSGIGPGTGIVMVSSMSVGEIREAIVSENVRAIQSIKGVGPKTAQRVILELKDKLRKDELLAKAGVDTVPLARQHNTRRSEALQALVTLGFARAAAEKNLDQIQQKHGGDLSVEDLIKFALKSH